LRIQVAEAVSNASEYNDHDHG